MNLKICAIVSLVIIFSGCTENNNDGNSEEDWRDWPIESNEIIQVQDDSEENTEGFEVFDITDNYVTRIIFILIWRDEPNATGYENQPDSFCMEVFTPWQETFNSDPVSNPIGGAGQINITIEIQEDDVANSLATGEWTVNIQCGECGNQQSQGPFGPSEIPDVGNQWELTVHYECHVKA